MTCIAGVVHGGVVYVAGDSAGCSGWDLSVRADEKVFKVGPYVMGYTSSFRMGQLLRYSLQAPMPPTENTDLHRFMCTEFVDALRKCLKDGGYATKTSDKEEGGEFLVGVSGRLFVVSADYQVGEHIDPFASVGCGSQIAHGALHAIQDFDLTPNARLSRALEAAERYSNGVRGPYRFVDTKEKA